MRVAGVDDFAAADKLILPGVGAFDAVMGRLHDSGLLGPLNHAVLVEKKPVLGICVGMQILADSSEEGTHRGLGWVPGTVTKLDVSNLARPPFLPHMGWNAIKAPVDSPLFRSVDQDCGFYFLHSYRFSSAPAYELAVADYGGDFTVAVRNDNVYGVQFHPEKSHRNGVALISNFAKL
jgi:glutamine amidotransferase